jgi:L-iditol 2-dehydrogenase
MMTSPFDSMKAAIVQPDFTLALADTSLPHFGPTDTLVQVIGCSVCGSDLDKIVNRRTKPGAILGHEVVGVIPDSGQRVVVAHHVPCGTCHFCRQGSASSCKQFKASNIRPGGFAQWIAVSDEHMAHTVFPIPDDISDAEASCVEPLACVLRAVERGVKTVAKPESVAIVGLGFIGMLAGASYRLSGVETVIGVDLDAERLALATQYGYVDSAFHAVEQREALITSLGETTPANGVDQVFLSVCTPKTWELALSLVRDGGSIVLFAASHTESPLDDAFIHPSQLYFREITVIPSYSPALPHLKQAAELVFSRRILVSPMLTHTLDLCDIQQAITLYQQGRAMKVFVRMPEPHSVLNATRMTSQGAQA